MQELGREPSSEEIARRMDIPVAKVRKVLKIAQEPISLETPIGEEEDSHLGDFIEDRQAVSPSEAVISVNLKEYTSQVLRTLTPREERVIKMRFGLEDGSEHTLEEVGQSFQVTRERIRQIEAKALRKLRHPSRSPQAEGVRRRREGDVIPECRHCGLLLLAGTLMEELRFSEPGIHKRRGFVWRGEVAEWLKAPASKADVAERLPRVRISPSPPLHGTAGRHCMRQPLADRLRCHRARNERAAIPHLRH